MKVLRGIYSFFSIFVTLPIWYYLVHVALAASHPDRLVWFLFWVYVPFGLVMAVIGRVIDNAAMDERFETWKKRVGRS